VCATCLDNELKGHPRGHNFQLRHQPLSAIPTDGSDLDDLQQLAETGNQRHEPQAPYVARLSDQMKLLSEASRDHYIKAEVERATNWRGLYSLYSRFENCVSTLAAKISADGIPVPPAMTSFQEMLEKNWNTGNAQETAFNTHRAEFDLADYSHDIDKRRLGNVLQKFVGEFMLSRGPGDSDDFLYSGFPSNHELPPTPIETKVGWQGGSLVY
jgi:hypothetical protein